MLKQGSTSEVCDTVYLMLYVISSIDFQITLYEAKKISGYNDSNFFFLLLVSK